MIKFFAQKNKACPQCLKHSFCRRGFTLVETLVAISIFTISILAVMATASKGIQDTGYAKKKMIATYLAQEGVEYIRNMRDTFTLYSVDANTGWTLFKSKFIASCQAGNGCFFDDSLVDYGSDLMPMTNLVFADCTSSTCSNAPLNYHSSTGKYDYLAGGVSSGFSRRIMYTPLANSDEVKISSTVFWLQGSGSYSVTSQENLFNWVE